MYLFKRKRAPLNNFYRAALVGLALELVGWGPGFPDLVLLNCR